MNRDEKAAVVDQIAEEFGSAEAIFAVDYRGISVAQAAELRARLRDADARFRVVKNSLSERAADKAGIESLKPLLIGPTALTFVAGDPAAAAKTLNDAAREMQLLEFKGGLLGGEALSADDVRSIARLPSREVLYGQLVGTIAAPLTGLARGLNALIGGLAIQLGAIAEQGLVTGEAPAATADADAPAATEEPAAATEEPTAATEESAAATEEPAPAEPAAEAAETDAAPAAEAAETDAAPAAEATPDTDETPAASDAATSDN